MFFRNDLHTFNLIENEKSSNNNVTLSTFNRFFGFGLVSWERERKKKRTRSNGEIYCHRCAQSGRGTHFGNILLKLMVMRGAHHLIWYSIRVLVSLDKLNLVHVISFQFVRLAFFSTLIIAISNAILHFPNSLSLSLPCCV